MAIQKCTECEKIKIYDFESMIKSREQAFSSLYKHPYLVPVSSGSGWTEFITIHYCTKCHSVFEQYTYSPMDETEVNEYAVRCLTDNDEEIDYHKHDLLVVAEYLISKDKAKEIQELTSKEGNTTVYLSGHVDQFKQLQNGDSIKLMDLRDELFTSFAELLHRYWQVRWFINGNYYIKVDVPNNTFIPLVQQSENHLGSGQNSYNLKSSHIVNVKDIEVFDPKLGYFTPLQTWNVPPEYDQSAKEVDEMFDLYKPIKEKYKEEFDKMENHKENKIKEIVTKIYGVEFS